MASNNVMVGGKKDQKLLLRLVEYGNDANSDGGI